MSTDTRISYLPTDGLSYDPEEPRYWDAEALNKELTRAYELCHGCRMCFKYCDSFPILFDLLDNRYDGDVRQVNSTDTTRIMDACFQCKLCEVQCPYTPRDDHEFQFDFPKLIHRYKAQEAKKKPPSLRDRVLRDPDASAKAARASFGMANTMNRVQAHRWMMEKVLGIHRDKDLPDFAATTFEKQAESRGKTEPASGKVEAVLFQTCYVQNNEPEIGFDTLDVLEKSEVRCACAKGLQCCGMPAWEQGNLEQVRKQARHNLDILMPYVESGSKVLAINPTCSMMMSREYPELLEGADRERARKLAAAVQNPTDFLWDIRKEERFNKDFKSTPGEKVSYHAPCHLRAQSVGFKGRDLLRQIPGVKASTTMECCGHDGTYAMKVESFEDSKRIGQKAFDGMKESNAEVWATDCPLAAIQFKQFAGVRPLHPMSILARAYREDGFPQKIVPPNEEQENAKGATQ
jgi:glycerol-3-phosphate dehydrogenase subunit C